MMLERMLLTVVGSATPCRASESGCGGGAIVEVVVIVIGVILVVVVLTGWVWFRWKRGPYPWIMRAIRWVERGGRG
jgi:hypothetical protein